MPLSSCARLLLKLDKNEFLAGASFFPVCIQMFLTEGVDVLTE